MTQAPPPPYGHRPEPSQGVSTGAVVAISVTMLLVGLVVGGCAGIFIGSVKSLFDEFAFDFEGQQYVDDHVELNVTSPANVTEGDAFDIVVTVRNTGADQTTLHSIDLYNSYLDGVEVLSSTPAFDSQGSMLGEYEAFRYDDALPPGAVSVVTLRARARKVGVWVGDLDVCIGSDVTFKTHVMTTTVEAATSP